jgi:DNA-binding transcriptional ArsR family regulator
MVEPGLAVVTDAAQAAALLDPLRLRLLEALAEPGSASSLSRRLRIPRQKINYHLRELEKRKLVELIEERRRGNCIERVVRATARTYVISPAALGPVGADPAAVQDRFSSAYLVASAARVVRDVATLRARASRADKKIATLTLDSEVRFASAAARAAFAEELAGAVARLVARYNDEQAPGGRRFRLLVAAHPVVGPQPGDDGNKPEDDSDEPGHTDNQVPDDQGPTRDRERKERQR